MIIRPLTIMAEKPTPVDPLNPLGLPPNTVRVRTSDGDAPDKGGYTSYETATLVQGTADTYDVYKSGTDFTNLLRSSGNVIEVLGANTTGITNMKNMFYGYNGLISVQLFDTSNVTDMSGMFYNCTNLTSIPLFNTSAVTIMTSTFQSCTKVETGALALYQQASSQSTPPTSHTATFRNCGAYTSSGQAELAQIPSSWK